MRAAGSSQLLSCIDDALRSLDEAITAEDDEEDAFEEEPRESSLPHADDAAYAELIEPAETLLPLMGPRAEPAGALLAAQLSQAAPADEGRRRREVLRRLSRLEPGTRWLQAALRSCVEARQSAALSCMVTAAQQRARPVSNSREGPAAEARIRAHGLVLAAGRVIRFREKSDCRSALRLWDHAAKMQSESPQHQQAALSGRAVATLEQRSSTPGQLAATEAENRWLRRAAQLQHLLQRSLVQASMSLQIAKADAFRTLKRHAVCQSTRTCTRWADGQERLTPVSISPLPAYGEQTRVTSARWLGCLLVQARLRVAGAAWRELSENATHQRHFKHVSLRPDGFLGVFEGSQRRAMERLAAKVFDVDDIGLGPVGCGAPHRAPAKWVC